MLILTLEIPEKEQSPHKFIRETLELQEVAIDVEGAVYGFDLVVLLRLEVRKLGNDGLSCFGTWCLGQLCHQGVDALIQLLKVAI
jgi:hypothetical protein